MRDFAQKGTQVSKAVTVPTSLLHRLGVARRARSDALRGSGVPTGRPALRPARGGRARRGALALAVLLALLAFAAPAALASPPTVFAHLGGALGVAVDQSNGDVYVADLSEGRIDKYDSAGNLLLAFGGVSPQSVAVDNDPFSPSYRDVYVAERGGFRVKQFSPTGEFLLMFGKGVDQGPHHPGNLCTAAFIVEGDKCGGASSGTGAGELSDGYPPVAVAASGDVWVGDANRLQEFNPTGEYLAEVALPAGTGPASALAIDTDPSSPSAGDFYVFSERKGESQRLTPPGSGSYTLSFEGQTTAPLPFNATTAEIQAALQALSTIGSGNVKVELHEEGRPVLEFGGALGDMSLPLIIASAGSVAMQNEGGSGHLVKLKSDGTPVATLDAAGHPNALGLDPATGDLFLSDQLDPGTGDGSATLLEYGPSGAQLESFGAGQVVGGPEGNALAFGDGAKRLYVVSGIALAFALPAPGPLLREGSLSAKPGPTVATLKAILTPEGALTEYHFQYVSDQRFKAEGFNNPSESSTATLPADFSEHQLAVAISGLVSETAYHFRLLAHNSAGEGNVTGSEEATFTTLPPVLIDSESVSDVASDSATLEARINTLGVADEYRFEYLTEAAYQHNIENSLAPFTGAALAPTPDAAIAAAEADQNVSQHPLGLQPSTVYRYRVLAHNSGGSAHGPTLTFTTQPAGGELALPDNRAWELVSPPDKHGAQLVSRGAQAAAAGNAITYAAGGPVGSEPQGNHDNRTLSRRGPRGWDSRAITVPRETAVGGTGPLGSEYRFFSEDLSLGVVQPFGGFPLPSSSASLSAEASEQTAYLRSYYLNNDVNEPCTSSCYRPLVTGAPGHENVPSGTVFGVSGGGRPCPPEFLCGPVFVGGTPDLSHVVLISEVPLTEAPGDKGGLYEWAAGRLTFIGTPFARNSLHAISADGSRVVFDGVSEGHSGLLMRDVASEETVQLDAAEPECKGKCASGGGLFAFASSDGSRVFFTDTRRLTKDAGAATGEPDLYECEMVVEAEKLRCGPSDLTPLGIGEAHAHVENVLGTSRDGSWVYFVALGKLASGAAECNKPGARCANLYVRHGGVSTLVAVLSRGDYPDWAEPLESHTSRVSPDGEWLAFMSQASLTGYDNEDVTSKAKGERLDEEVYLYHASTGALVCASCDPTGARPVGVEWGKLGELVGGLAVWEPNRWIAANVPGWNAFVAPSFSQALYQSRYLSDSGRLFFNSGDALVPQDVNGTEDVYQYEPEGVPAGVHACSPSSTSGSEVFKPARAVEVEGRKVQEGAGCLALISSGSSSEESAFLDANETGGRDSEGHEGGGDVFFLTSARLSSRDFDTSVDVYDAHECIAQSPCVTSAAQPPPCLTEASCKASPTPQPAFPSGGVGTAAVFGEDNLTVPPPTPVSKPPTRAQKLAKALSSCRARYKKSKRRRAACERQARRQYGAKAKAKKAGAYRKAM
jgi:hypothetical protein